MGGAPLFNPRLMKPILLRRVKELQCKSLSHGATQGLEPHKKLHAKAVMYVVRLHGVHASPIDACYSCKHATDLRCGTTKVSLLTGSQRGAGGKLQQRLHKGSSTGKGHPCVSQLEEKQPAKVSMACDSATRAGNIEEAAGGRIARNAAKELPARAHGTCTKVARGATEGGFRGCSRLGLHGAAPAWAARNQG
ncbi:hypothetical protein L7F22_047792, partial [Adiantum nelumboides]|nr:hypothetical protein [Adiantum nelumboides]